MKLEITNSYSDGHESTLTVTFDGPAWTEPTIEDVTIDKQANDGLSDYEGSFWQEHIFDFTGDGHGDGSNGKLGYCHTAVITEADNPELVGKSYEWCGY